MAVDCVRVNITKTDSEETKQNPLLKSKGNTMTKIMGGCLSVVRLWDPVIRTAQEEVSAQRLAHVKSCCL